MNKEQENEILSELKKLNGYLKAMQDLIDDSNDRLRSLNTLELMKRSS